MQADMASQHTASTDWLDRYGNLAKIDDPAWNRIVRTARQVDYRPDQPIFRDGEACQYYLLVVSGSVKVRKISPDGHEIVLYHVKAGQTCELTTTCLLGGQRYVAEAVAETPSRVVLIAKNQFQEAMATIPDFREFVYRSLDKGMGDLVNLVEDVAFGRMNQRLAHYLISNNDQSTVAITHQELAVELGSAREVISRLLKNFERQNWVRLHRGKIEIIDPDALSKLASSQSE